MYILLKIGASSRTPHSKHMPKLIVSFSFQATLYKLCNTNKSTAPCGSWQGQQMRIMQSHVGFFSIPKMGWVLKAYISLSCGKGVITWNLISYLVGLNSWKNTGSFWMKQIQTHLWESSNLMPSQFLDLHVRCKRNKNSKPYMSSKWWLNW